MDKPEGLQRFKIIIKEGRYVICNLISNTKKFNPATAYVIKDAISEIKPYYTVDQKNSSGLEYYTNICSYSLKKEKLVEILKGM